MCENVYKKNIILKKMIDTFKIYKGLFKIIHNLNYYTQFTSILTYFISIFMNFKYPNKLHNLFIQNNKITISLVYFRNLSPLRKETNSKQIIYDISENNIKNTWKIYESLNHKPKIGDMIEVHYSVPYENLKSQTNIKFNHKPYIVTYVYPSNIKFPPYDLESLRAYNNTNNYKNGVLFATYKNKDITEEAIKLAGPLGNFYSDLPSRYGIKITNNVLIDNLIDNENIIITNNNGDDFKFGPDSILKI